MSGEELRSCELLLDLGIRIPVRPLRWLGRKKKPGKVTLRRPYAGTLIAMTRYYNRIGVTVAEMKEYGTDDWAKLIAAHGHDMARIVACALCRGFVSHRLFSRLVAWWLLWRVHPSVLGDVMLLLIESIDTRPFQITISSVETVNLMKPRLSHEANGS
ncbi:hypothetical protein [Bacteroides pyogenes]|uniref:hypothetical protein n=1 Tax=Bacteroides pyogenes TaxID=310300 RepID=UPI001BA9D403|nr:hypothetical protein [Bacteroides pyogenes]MBR8705889.1 hypothetical protein [Bacteroides pyogenes]MBR8726663.1 hypothetical protein [Bacteroides pyogenes]MBR8740056.1 hypothetical protein [Bacteroides pyogenes]MBR8755809.1 hypothetical protein [Bacteroides pyogenes]MBR8797124.1 hypothetical protein [Bacteroides pyogenes]